VVADDHLAHRQRIARECLETLKVGWGRRLSSDIGRVIPFGTFLSTSPTRRQQRWCRGSSASGRSSAWKRVHRPIRLRGA